MRTEGETQEGMATGKIASAGATVWWCTSYNAAMIGRTVSHYRILEQLGSGGMGVVYKAEDTQLRRFVALKFLSEDSPSDSQSIERLLREARAASALNHPNICTIYEIGQDGDRPFLAMEFLEGQTLKERIARGGFTSAELLDFAIQVAGALDAAHAQGNYSSRYQAGEHFCGEYGTSEGAGFWSGEACGRAGEGVEHAQNLQTRSVEPLQSAAGSVAGTVTYMSPEQVRGEQLDARSDLFSFGAVLYEVSTGKAPFPGETTGVIFDAILNRAPVTPSRLNPQVLPKFEEIIHKALEKDRELRYQSAGEMRSDLRRLKRDSESGNIAPMMAAPPSGKTRGGRMLIYSMVAIAVVLAAVGAGIWWYRMARPAVPTSTSWQQITFFTDSAVYPALSPDGRMLAFIRGADTFFGPGQVYVKMLPDGEPVALTHDATAKMDPVFSPDGSRIAYGTATPFDTWEVPVLGGEAHLRFPNASSLTWIEGGKRLMFSEIKKWNSYGRGELPIKGAGKNGTCTFRSAIAAWRTTRIFRQTARCVLVVEMGPAGAFAPCRVAPLRGRRTIAGSGSRPRAFALQGRGLRTASGFI